MRDPLYDHDREEEEMQRTQRDWEEPRRPEHRREDLQGYESRRGPHRAGRGSSDEAGGWYREPDPGFEAADFEREEGRRERRRGSYETATSFGGEDRQGGRGGQRRYGAEGAASRRGSFEDSEPIFSYTEVWLIEGPHTGRGPKGFQRSDERLREQVCERLERHGAVDASEIDVQVEDGVVTLEGSVDDRRTKRLAEECAETIPGIRDVMNRLRVDQGFFQRVLGLGGSEEQEEAKATSSWSARKPHGG